MLLAGEIASETRAAVSTVKMEKSLTPPKLALMLAVPFAIAVAVSVAPPPLPTVATDSLFDVQWLLAVMSWVVESENSPVAVNPFCAPIGIVAADGVTEMDVIVAFVIVRFTD